jgi:UDP-glucose 4-epimerase
MVTGASGFIGSHLVRRLTGLGAEVHLVSRRLGSGASNPAWHVADLTDLGTCYELVGEVSPDVVFHLASAVTGVRDVDLVVPLMMANQATAVNLLAAVARWAPTTRVILTGSVEEPHEGRDLTPTSPYAAAKSAATLYSRMFWRLWDVRVTVLQIAMVYGPAQPDLTKLVPYATLALLRGCAPQLSSGTRLIDWVYLDDVVDALVSAAEADTTIGEVIDIGSGQLVSIRDTVELLASIVGTSVQPQFSALNDRPMDLAQPANPRAAAELLNWRASTPLEEGLRRTIDWYARSLQPAVSAGER